MTPSSSGSYTTSFHSSTHSFVVPEGVTEIAYELAGGGGGLSLGGSLAQDTQAGSGDLITGMISVVPGMVLDLVVGNGGIGVGNSGTENPAGILVRGGSGFGKGGDVQLGDVACRYSGASGGGGSAILVRSVDSPDTSVPLVIAGGGGGSGGIWLNSSPEDDASVTALPHGGDGGLEADQGNDATLLLGAKGIDQHANGGRGAAGATPGNQPNAGQSQAEGSDSEGHFINYGLNGGEMVAGKGGAGADGRQSATVVSASGGLTYTVTSGGAGGGYAGGASGDATAYVFPPRYVGLGAGGGGGGSSFVTPDTVDGAVVLTSDHTKAGNQATQPNKRMPGWLALTYYECV